MKKWLTLTMACLMGAIALFALGGCKDKKQKEIAFAEEIHISTKEDLAKMQKEKGDAYVRYVLDNDIDCQGLSYDAGVLCGQLDGQGHIIKNIHIRSSNNAYGLFRSLDDTENYKHSIVNLALVDFTLEMRSNSEEVYAGAFVGFAKGGYNDNTFEIKNCYAKGKITANNEFAETGSQASFGGFLGYAERTVMENCHSDVSIDTSGSKNAWKYYIGGFIGQSGYDTTIKHCVFQGEITAASQGRGIVYVTAISYVGGIIGYVYDQTVIDGCVSVADAYYCYNQTSYNVAHDWALQEGDSAKTSRVYYAYQTIFDQDAIDRDPDAYVGMLTTSNVTVKSGNASGVEQVIKDLLLTKEFMTGTGTYKNKYGEDSTSDLDFDESVWNFFVRVDGSLPFGLKAFYRAV